jgi:hypothetical protein
VRRDRDQKSLDLDQQSTGACILCRNLTIRRLPLYEARVFWRQLGLELMETHQEMALCCSTPKTWTARRIPNALAINKISRTSISIWDHLQGSWGLDQARNRWLPPGPHGHDRPHRALRAFFGDGRCRRQRSMPGGN